MADESPDWLVRLYEEQGATLHRLTVLLGAEEQSGRILRGALLALHRRSQRLIDPAERVEFMQESVVHAARVVRPPQQPLELPRVDDPRQNELLAQISALPPRMAEIIVVSHYLAVFGPELAGIMRMSVRGCNQKLEIARETLRANVRGDGIPGGIEALSQEVTAALRAAARTVQAPGTSTLAAELGQLGSDARVTFGPRSVAVLTALAIVAGLVLAALTTPSAAPVEQPPASPDQTVAPTAGRSIPAQVRGVPLYYVGRDGGLYRELRDLSSSGNLVGSAVDALLTVPAADPDYRSMWTAGRLISVEQSGDAALTVNLSAEAYEAIESDQDAELARNQMVYTISDLVADPYLSVQFQSDGGAPPARFASESGYRRQDLAPMPDVWITAPRNLATLSGDLTITGTVKPGLGEPVVRITNTDSGAVVAEESAQTSAEPNPEGWRPWSVTATLPPGRYEVSVRTPKNSAKPVETKTFEVK